MDEKYVPPVNLFTETEVLWRVMRQEPDEARRLIDGMSREERATFASCLRGLHRMISTSLLDQTANR